MIREHGGCEALNYLEKRPDEPVTWQTTCRTRDRVLTWEPRRDPQVKLDAEQVVSRVVAGILAHFTDAMRLETIAHELLSLRQLVAELKQSGRAVVPIETLAPEPLKLLQCFHVIVEPYEDEFRASFPDANLSAFGETQTEAIWNLKDLISATFEMLLDLGESRLGPGPARQFEVLRQFIRKQ